LAAANDIGGFSIAFSLRVKLTPEEFASLKEVGVRPPQRTIPDAHRERLIAAGYVREVVRSSVGVGALALTDEEECG
jgi:hypothetical protein